MESDDLKIGELAKRSGLPVKTIRFYSDEGLLPPAARGENGYRLFSEKDVARLDLISTLREAGLGLATIRSILERDMTLAQGLELRLHAVEAHVASLQKVAAALRATLRSDPDENDLRRLHAVTRLTNEERKAVIEGFFERITEGIPVDQQWVATMMAGSSPELPEDPTREQLDAWIELAEIVTDEGFIAEMRATTEKFWSEAPEGFEPGALFKAYAEVSDDATRAMAAGVDASSSEAAGIAERVITSHANAVQKTDDAAFRASMLHSYATQDPRAARYWELLATIRGDEQAAQQTKVTNWIAEAVRVRLSG